MKDFLNKHGRLLGILAPTLLGVVYIILCAVNLQQSIWFDESYGAYLTRYSFGEIWEMTAVDVHPPLYYFLLKIWSGVFGYTDFGMRFMSVFFGAVAIVFAWCWIKRRFGLKAALLSGLFMAISPVMIRYGQEMRMYAMAAAIVFASLYVLDLAIDLRKRRYWVIYGVLMALGMWTHYFVALVFLAQLWYLIWVYRKKIFQKDIILAYGLAVVLYLPWIPSFLSQSSTVQGGFWIGAPSMNTMVDYFTIGTMYHDGGEVNGWLLPLCIAVLACLIFLTRKLDGKARILKIFAFVPPVILLLISMPPIFKPMFVDRYVVYSMVGMVILAGVGIVTVKFRKKIVPYLMAAGFLGCSVIGIVHVYHMGNYNYVTGSKSDAKALYNFISENSEDGVPIISNSEWLFYDLIFYDTPEHPVYFLDELVSYVWGSHKPLEWHDKGKIKDLDAFLQEHEKVWWVGSWPEDQDTDLEFPREGYKVLQRAMLDVNVNSAGYQALELSKRSETDYTLEHRRSIWE